MRRVEAGFGFEFAGFVFVQVGAENGADGGDVTGRDEIFEVLVFENEGAVLVRGEKLGGAVRAEVFAGAVVLGDAGHGILRADGEDEFEGRFVEGVGGGEEGESAGEGQAHDAYGATGLFGEPLGGLADGADGGGADVVILDVGKLWGEDAEAAGGHGGGEGLKAGLVDAEMVDAVQDDEGGGVLLLDFGKVKAGADGTGFGGDGKFFGRDGVGDDVADKGWDGVAGDLVEDGDGFEVIFDKGPGGEEENDEAGSEQNVEGAAVGSDACGGAGKTGVQTMKSAGEGAATHGMLARGTERL